MEDDDSKIDLEAPWDPDRDPLMRGYDANIRPVEDGWFANLAWMILVVALLGVVTWGFLSGNRGVVAFAIIPTAVVIGWWWFRTSLAAVVTGLIGALVFAVYFFVAFKYM